MSVVNKHLKTKSLLTTPINVLPLHLKQTFLPIIWRWRWWDQIQTIFYNSFYFKVQIFQGGHSVTYFVSKDLHVYNQILKLQSAKQVNCELQLIWKQPTPLAQKSRYLFKSNLWSNLETPKVQNKWTVSNNSFGSNRHHSLSNQGVCLQHFFFASSHRRHWCWHELPIIVLWWLCPNSVIVYRSCGELYTTSTFGDQTT